MKTCLKCTKKHLTRAYGLLDESTLGYPIYRAYAYGEMSLAESECVQLYPILAEQIREERKKMDDNDTYQPLLEELITMVLTAIEAVNGPKLPA